MGHRRLHYGCLTGAEACGRAVDRVPAIRASQRLCRPVPRASPGSGVARVGRRFLGFIGRLPRRADAAPWQRCPHPRDALFGRPFRDWAVAEVLRTARRPGTAGGRAVGMAVKELNARGRSSALSATTPELFGRSAPELRLTAPILEGAAITLGDRRAEIGKAPAQVGALRWPHRGDGPC
jgi:hypothetical protein